MMVSGAAECDATDRDYAGVGKRAQNMAVGRG